MTFRRATSAVFAWPLRPRCSSLRRWPLSAQSDDRRRAVGDWLVEDVGDDEGGRTVRMTREDGDYSLDYHMNISPGAADFASQGFMVWRLTCGQGGEESLDGGPAGRGGARDARPYRRLSRPLRDAGGRRRSPASASSTGPSRC